jgi:hypothetical protein
MCVSICTGLAPGADAFSITTVPSLPNTAVPAPAAPATGAALQNSVSGFSFFDAQATPGVAAACLYDFLLIAGASDAITGNAADRYCGNALNPIVAPVPLPATGTAVTPGIAASVHICSKFNNNSNTNNKILL